MEQFVCSFKMLRSYVSELFTSGMEIFTTTFSNLRRALCFTTSEAIDLVGLSISKADVIVGN